ncbi:hypothetical protein QAD02_005557 [Eretmocerus hayati]|uniref:Uncharacterized protein n=1 Tax=Eretmocerus hayati TaxID=131215 RepID=A0ACC2NXM3_9HYME|nr:hypothetical protein QAD02_005557 [Eretmocerus hayati]
MSRRPGPLATSTQLSGPLATSTQLSPLADRLLSAQSILDDLESQKVANASVNVPSSAKKSKTTAKQPKVKIIPNASQTIKSQVLDKYKTAKALAKKNGSIVAKTKVANNSSSTAQLVSPRVPAVNEQNVVDLSLTKEQLDELQRRIASGQINLRTFLNGQKTMNTPPSPALIPESQGFNDDSEDVQDRTKELFDGNKSSEVSQEIESQLVDDDQMDYENQLGLEEDDETPDLLDDDNLSVVSEKDSLANMEEQFPENHDEVPTNNDPAKDGQIVILQPNVTIAGKDVNLSELHNLVHSEHCCAPCRHTMQLILEGINELKLNASSKASPPKMMKPNPADYPLLPPLPCKTHEELLFLNELVNQKDKKAANQYISFLGSLGGLDPKTAIKTMLEQTMTNTLSRKCTWKIPKPDEDGNPKLVIGEFYIFEIMSAVNISNWKGHKSPDDPAVEIPVTRHGNFKVMKDWVKRASRRVANENKNNMALHHQIDV